MDEVDDDESDNGIDNGIDFERLGLLDKNRLIARVPAYESNHMRHYLTDWEQYKRNQPEPREQSKLRKNYIFHIKNQLESLSSSERVELIIASIPELASTMEQLRKNSLKYNMLMNRLNGKEIDTVLQGNLKVEDKNNPVKFNTDLVSVG